MRIGLAGVGRIGSMHGAVLASMQTVSELILFDADPARAATIATTLSAAHVDTLEDLLDAGLDGLVVATASGSHAELVRRFVAEGVPVFCEKPVALTRAETEDVLAHVTRSQVPVQVGFHRRFDPGYVTARTALRNGELGELRRVHVVSADPEPPDAAFIATSGGIFRDLHIHDFDVLRWVTGREVEWVQVSGANRGAAFFTAAGDVDECVALLGLDDGTLVTLQGSRYNGAGYDVRMELAGTHGTRVVGLADQAPFRSAEPDTAFPPGPPWKLFSDRFRAAYHNEITAFLEVAAGRMESPCTVADALVAFHIADAASLSLRENRPVRVEEVITAAETPV